MVNAIWMLAKQLLAAPTCIVCGQSAPISGSRLDLCDGCARDLPTNTHACALCAIPLPREMRNAICGACLRKPPRYQASFCAFRYAYPVDHLVRALKFHGRLSYGRTLGALLADAMQCERTTVWPELMIPVPLADERFRERGFNQAIELGRVIERRTDIPLCTDLAVRTRATREQTGLSGKERRKNIRGAFALRTKLAARHIAIVDDVVTTGSTVAELSRVLRRAGAKRIEVWAVARTANT